MSEGTTTRKLATIMMADIAGYSRLMGAAERHTHTRVTSLQRELIEPTIKDHRGTLVGVRGDGFLAAFDSPVECVRCAIVIQQSMVGRNLELPPASQIRFRIGINLGDVIFEAGDIYGDGVNVAARLEAEAEPGTINISASVFEQVRYKLVCGYQALGDKKLKNIQDPVSIYRVLPDPTAVASASRTFSLRTAVIACVGVLLLVGAGAYAWQRVRPLGPALVARSPPVAPPTPRPEEVVDRLALPLPTPPALQPAVVVPPPAPQPTVVVSPPAIQPPLVHSPEV